MRSRAVITSYSIHYTKLYEVPAVAPVRAAAPATPAAVAAMPVSAAVDEGPMRLVGEEPARADLAPERGLLLPLN